MKTILIIVILMFPFFHYTNAQSPTGWSIPKHEIVFMDENGDVAKMSLDPGFRFADIEFQEKSYRVFYHRNNMKFKNARIVDNASKKVLAKGRGLSLSRSGRLIFESGDEIKLLIKRYPNGYEILGPYGTLFKVENHGIIPVKILDEKDFLAQGFFIFDRLKTTQTPPAEVIMLMTSSNLQ